MILMKKRIFIAIKVPEEVAVKLLEFQNYWSGLSARWTEAQNLHLTLVFMGYITKEEVEETVCLIKDVARNHGAFSVSFSRVRFGPPKQNPRMVWAECEPGKPLLLLQKDTLEALYQSPHSGYKEKETPNQSKHGTGQARVYHPHLTLSRFDPQSFSQKGYDKKETIDFAEKFSAESIEVMESVLKRTGARYRVVESISGNGGRFWIRKATSILPLSHHYFN